VLAAAGSDWFCRHNWNACILRAFFISKRRVRIA
jgi:hypothetical protein